MDPQKKTDHDALATALADLLQGNLKVDFSILPLGKALKRSGKDTEWLVRGLSRWLAESEEALPLLAGALTQQGAQRLREALQRRYPDEFAQPAEAEVHDD